jgi:hypothetical protein
MSKSRRFSPLYEVDNHEYLGDPLRRGFCFLLGGVRLKPARKQATATTDAILTWARCSRLPMPIWVEHGKPTAHRQYMRPATGYITGEEVLGEEQEWSYRKVTTSVLLHGEEKPRTVEVYFTEVIDSGREDMEPYRGFRHCKEISE